MSFRTDFSTRGVMAKRQRDYRAEERRRNELARQRGFTTRAAERGAKKRADHTALGFPTFADYTKARASAESWSDIHSHTPKSEFRSSFNAQRTKDYIAAYDVDSKDRKGPERSRALRKYLTTYYPGSYPNENDSKYWSNY